MENNSIVISTFAKSDKVLAGPRSYITVKLNVQITMSRMQLYIAFLLGILLNFDIFKFIFSDWIKSGGSE